jgi:hypothetical protein
MKKTLLFLVITFLAVNLSHAQSKWIKYQVDDHLFINVPLQPEKVSRGVMAKTADGLICFIGNVEAGDSTSLVKMSMNGDFANSVKTSMLGYIRGVTFGDVKSSQWNGHYCFYVDGENFGNLLKAYFYFVIIGKYVYTFGAMIPESHNQNVKDTFFNSLSTK